MSKYFCLLILALLACACGAGSSKATPVPPTATPVPPTARPATATPPPTQPPPTDTPAATRTASLPSATPEPTESEAATPPPTPVATTSDLAPTEPSPNLRLTIVYDNTAYDQRLTAEWGFAAWVEYGEHTLLFDTGGNGITLLDNIAKLGLDPQDVEVVVLSHEHGDHTGGLTSLLRRASRPTVYVPASFSASFKRSAGALTDLVEVSEPVEIWPGVHTTGQVHGGVTEQGLVIETDQGIVVITGCAHPGVVNMVRRARQVVDDQVALVVGGFHLGGASSSQVERIIDQLGELDVRQVCPTHCTGEASIAMFAEAYGDDYVQGGVGRIINMPGGEE